MDEKGIDVEKLLSREFLREEQRVDCLLDVSSNPTLNHVRQFLF